MRFLDRLPRPLFLALLVSGAAALVEHVALPPFGVTASAEEPTPPSGYLWLDVDGKPLPFQDHDTIREAMRSAPVVSQKPIGRGVGGSIKLVLEVDEIRFHAVFRVIDRTERVATSSSRMRRTYRDSHIFEVAAYEVDQMLGIERIPPAVLRTLDGRDGSVQIWMEATAAEDVLLHEDRLDPPDVRSWRRQKRVMRVFDTLVANTDRNRGNILIDRNWRLWLIDHTRSFGESTRLLNVDRITACDRPLWTALSQIDDATIRQRLEPYLTSKQISRLLLRRVKLIKRIQKQIDKNGEDAVLFDLDP